MTCNNKKCGCAKRTQPREEMLDMASFAALSENGADVVRCLLAAARGGVAELLKFNLPSGELSNLARAIALLYEDHNRLQKLLDSVEAVEGIDVATSPTDVKIGFGPDKKYKLIVPLAGAVAKHELAMSLHDTATDPARDARQLPLPLDY